MRAYSKDLRQKIVEALERGTPKAQAARLFGVCLSSVKRYSRIARQGGSLSPKKGSGRPPKVDEYAQKLLEEDVKERPVKERPASHYRAKTSLAGAPYGEASERLHLRGALKAPRL